MVIKYNITKIKVINHKIIKQPQCHTLQSLQQQRHTSVSFHFPLGGSGCEVVVGQVVGGGGLLVGLQWLDVSIGDWLVVVVVIDGLIYLCGFGFLVGYVCTKKLK